MLSLIGSILLAVVLNLVASYLKPYIDKWKEQLFDVQRVRSERKRAEITSLAKYMLDDPVAFTWRAERITYAWLRFAVVAVAELVFVSTPGMMVSLAQIWRYFPSHLPLHLPFSYVEGMIPFVGDMMYLFMYGGLFGAGVLMIMEMRGILFHNQVIATYWKLKRAARRNVLREQGVENSSASVDPLSSQKVSPSLKEKNSDE